MRGNRRRAKGLALGAFVAAIGLAGCDLEVTNPGPVADESLNSAAAFRATVNGAIRTLSEALSVVGVDVAIRTREMHPTAINDYFGIEPNAWTGQADADNTVGWSEGHDARWLADDAVRRFEAVLGTESGSNALVAEATLWGGYAYRLMGEYFCEAVFDGGPAESGDRWFEIAESRFSDAIQMANAAGRSDMAMAAQAGRASVRLSLGDWAGAVADAGAIPTSFEWAIPYYSSGDWRLYNVFYYYSAPEAPSQVFSVWNTVYEDYYLDSGDPRTPWESDPDREFGSGSLDGQQVPWWRPVKYAASNAAIPVSPRVR